MIRSAQALAAILLISVASQITVAADAVAENNAHNNDDNTVTDSRDVSHAFCVPFQYI